MDEREIKEKEKRDGKRKVRELSAEEVKEMKRRRERKTKIREKNDERKEKGIN